MEQDLSKMERSTEQHLNCWPLNELGLGLGAEKGMARGQRLLSVQVCRF